MASEERVILLTLTVPEAMIVGASVSKWMADLVNETTAVSKEHLWTPPLVASQELARAAFRVLSIPEIESLSRKIGNTVSAAAAAISDEMKQN